MERQRKGRRVKERKERRAKGRRMKIRMMGTKKRKIRKNPPKRQRRSPAPVRYYDGAVCDLQ